MENKDVFEKDEKKEEGESRSNHDSGDEAEQIQSGAVEEND